jgi:predicted nucleotidyltransferase
MKQKKKLTDEEKKHLIQRITAFLQTKEYILFAYIFGSFPSGKNFNDIDVAIFISADKFDSLLVRELEIERELGDVLHLPIDVRIINSAPLPFTYNVLKSGTVILDNDKSVRTDFEGLIYKKYFDYMHLRNEYLREIINAAV